MHIFIDESGTFTGNQQETSVSVVGALVVPDARLAKIEEKYAALRDDLPSENGEVKGRRLDERHIEAVVAILKRYEVLFEAVAIDMAIHSDALVDRHKSLQEEGITERLDEHSPEALRRRAFDLRRRLERLSRPLYVQSAVTVPLVETTIHHAIQFYCQRMPSELGAFSWVIDGKERDRITEWEDWWSQTISQMLESRSFLLNKPLVTWEECDYSHLERFKIELDDRLKALTPYRVALDAVPIMRERFRFSGAPEPGLELVDILTGATRRALLGHLDESGWRGIGQLMIHRGGSYIQDVALRESRGESGTFTAACSYGAVLRKFSRGGKEMVAPRFRRGFRSPGM